MGERQLKSRARAQDRSLTKKSGPPEVVKKDRRLGLWESITLEPMWLGVTISATSNIATVKNMFLRNICTVELDYPQEICANASGEIKSTIEMESQHIYTQITGLSYFINGVLSSIVILFLAPWSDSSGRRKPLIVLPILFMMLITVSMAFILKMPNIPTIFLIYFQHLPTALGMDFGVLAVASYNYLGDICYKTGRDATTVMGSNTTVMGLSVAFGLILFAMFDRMLSTSTIFFCCAGLQLISAIYAMIRVKDVNVSDEKYSLFDIRSPMKAFQCVFKKRDGSKRKNILLMITVPCVNTIVTLNDFSVSYLYLRNRFSWNAQEYYYLSLFKMFTSSCGTFFIVNVMKNKLKLTNKTIGLIGAWSLVASSLVFFVSNQPWMLYLSAVIGILSRGSLVAERPILNEQILAHEQGKVSCVASILEKCVSFMTAPLINIIYKNTLSTMPSIFILMTTFSGLVQVFCYLMFNENKKEEEEKPEKEKH